MKMTVLIKYRSTISTNAISHNKNKKKCGKNNTSHRGLGGGGGARRESQEGDHYKFPKKTVTIPIHFGTASLIA